MVKTRIRISITPVLGNRSYDESRNVGRAYLPDGGEPLTQERRAGMPDLQDVNSGIDKRIIEHAKKINLPEQHGCAYLEECMVILRQNEFS